MKYDVGSDCAADGVLKSDIALAGLSADSCARRWIKFDCFCVAIFRASRNPGGKRFSSFRSLLPGVPAAR